jgi:hypothetical protein
MTPWIDTLRSPKPSSDLEEIRLRSTALFRAEQSQDLQGLIAEKISELRHYDVLGMDRVAAILMWGRSGSLLLSSYLDGHEDVLLLPETYGQKLYEFFERHRSLPLRDKLLAYPALEPEYPKFFEGPFAISSTQYYAAVRAIVESYGNWPADFLESRRAFFLFVHIAYNMALGRRPATGNPLIVYSQHVWDDVAAKNLVDDFPQAKFIHTIRDPISSCDGVFHFHFSHVEKHIPAQAFLPMVPYLAVYCVMNKDCPHPGMESRTRTIRFEDLHRDAAETIRDLSDWLGIERRASLLDSTFNGIPYVVARDGNAWSGPRLEQVQRRSSNLSRKDQALLFASMYENFADWNYACPRLFGNRLVRFLVFISLFLLPTKMEIKAMRAVFRCRVWPAARRGNLSPALRALLGIALCRLKIVWRLVSLFSIRIVGRTTLLQVDHKKHPLKRHDAATLAASNET